MYWTVGAVSEHQCCGNEYSELVSNDNDIFIVIPNCKVKRPVLLFNRNPWNGARISNSLPFALRP